MALQQLELHSYSKCGHSVSVRNYIIVKGCNLKIRFVCSVTFQFQWHWALWSETCNMKVSAYLLLLWSLNRLNKLETLQMSKQLQKTNEWMLLSFSIFIHSNWSFYVWVKQYTFQDNQQVISKNKILYIIIRIIIIRIWIKIIRIWLFNTWWQLKNNIFSSSVTDLELMVTYKHVLLYENFYCI